MIRHLEHTAIDKQKWDASLAKSANACIYATSWWLDIVSPNWEALVLNDYAAIMPLTKRKKFGFSYLFQPPFTQQLGIFSATKIDVEQFIAAIPPKFRLIEIQLNTGNRMQETSTVRVLPRKTHHLELNADSSVIRKNYSENTRRNIKKFEKSGSVILSSENAQEIIDLFRQNKGASIETLKESDYLILQQLIQTAREKKLLTILTAYNSEQKPTAGAFFIQSDQSYIFLFSAVNAEARENGAMAALIDRFIQQHAGENKYLDFEGSIIPDLARFYKSFGSEEIVYLQIRKNTLPPIIRRLK